MDTVFFGFCMNISAHFEILRNLINEIKLEDFVEYHLQITHITKRLNKLFNVIIFTEYVFITLMLCTTGFQIVMCEDSIRIFAAVFHGIACIIDILIYSYGGQMIISSACAVTKDFYEFDKEYILVLMRTKLDVKINSLFYTACLPESSLIMGRTMSLITMLKSFVK